MVLSSKNLCKNPKQSWIRWAFLFQKRAVVSRELLETMLIIKSFIEKAENLKQKILKFKKNWKTLNNAIKKGGNIPLLSTLIFYNLQELK